MKVSRTKLARIIGMFGCVLVILSMFLQYVTVSITAHGQSASASIKYIDGIDGKISIGIVLLALILIYLKRKTIISVVLMIVVAVLASIGLSNAASEAVEMNNFADVAITHNLGVYALFIGCALAIAHIFIPERESKSKPEKETDSKPKKADSKNQKKKTKRKK